MTEVQLAKRQIELLSIAEGFFDSQVLFAVHRLGVFRALAYQDKTNDELACELSADAASLVRLLNAAVALGLLETTADDRFRLSADWKPLLTPGADSGYLGNWLDYLATLSDTYCHLDQAARNGGPVRDLWNGKDPRQTRQNILAMHDYAVTRGKELARYLDVSRAGRLLDVGCGPGTYAFQLAQQNPQLEICLLDRPEVLTVTQEIQTRYPIPNRVCYLPVDLMHDDIPGTYDVILASNVLHAFAAGDLYALLAQLYQSLVPGGCLAVHSSFLNQDRRGPRWPVLVDLNLLCLTARGQNHSVADMTRLLSTTGFVQIEMSSMSLLGSNQLIRAQRP